MAARAQRDPESRWKSLVAIHIVALNGTLQHPVALCTIRGSPRVFMQRLPKVSVSSPVVRAVLEERTSQRMVSTNPINVVRATSMALKMNSPEMVVAAKRGKSAGRNLGK